MSRIHPIGGHEGQELAETADYYIRRNAEARGMLTHSDKLPAMEDARGTPLMHYESMVIHSVEKVAGPGVHEGCVRLHPALPVNGASEPHALMPIEVTLLNGLRVQGGFIALLQRMNASGEIAMVYFYSDRP